MITVRIDNNPNAIFNFRMAMRSVWGSDVTEESSDLEYVWFNVTSDDDEELEAAVSEITSSYTHY